MSGGLAPSKSTMYISNLPYSLTNNDIHKVFEEYGKIVRVTVMRDKVTRKSRGVAFVLFLRKEDAFSCVSAINGLEMFGRIIKASIAADNGRSAEFVRRRVYPDKSRCYECGEEGHLSYQCPTNVLGEREPPPKKSKKRKKGDEDEAKPDDETDDEPVDDEYLGAAIAANRAQLELEGFGENFAGDDRERAGTSNCRKKFRRDSYFSDEECSD